METANGVQSTDCTTDEASRNYSKDTSGTLLQWLLCLQKIDSVSGIFTYIYTCVRIYIYKYIYIYIHIYDIYTSSIYIYIDICIYIRIYIYKYVTYMNMYISLYN
jgi:hypothetical protein